MANLEQHVLEQWLANHPDWRLEDGKLCNSLLFEDFNAAWGFMSRAALIAEQLGHHPEWANIYDRVEVVLYTHDSGGITEKDLELADAMARLLE